MTTIFKVGDLITYPSSNGVDRLYYRVLRRYFASLQRTTLYDITDGHGTKLNRVSLTGCTKVGS